MESWQLYQRCEEWNIRIGTIDTTSYGFRLCIGSHTDTVEIPFNFLQYLNKILNEDGHNYNIVISQNGESNGKPYYLYIKLIKTVIEE